MGKAWGLFFAVNMVLCGLLFVIAPSMGWWLPESYSTHAGEVDFLFYVILWITTFFFILTEAILVVFLWKYGSGEKWKAPATPGGIVKLAENVGLSNQHRIEMAWTIVPAAILLYIAFAQIGAWARIKYQSNIKAHVGDKAPVLVDVTARQFEWRVRYPSSQRLREWLANPKRDDVIKEMNSFARNAHADDVHLVNEVHIWKDNPLLVSLSTRDVLHSFNLPHFRVKQDALPGKIIPVWLTPTKANTVKTKDQSGNDVWVDGGGRGADALAKDKTLVWDIACAELCGWGHWRMIGRIYVHETQEDFLEWLASAEKNEYSRTAAK